MTLRVNLQEFSRPIDFPKSKHLQICGMKIARQLLCPYVEDMTACCSCFSSPLEEPDGG